ncbi:MAG: GGDEF domain-containing protein [Ilumatobacteraceae bacterium]
MKFSPRLVGGLLLAAIAVTPAAVAHASAPSVTATSADAIAASARIADDAADLIAEEQALLGLTDPTTGSTAAELAAGRARLRTVDAEGAAALAQFDSLGVDVTQAMRATLELLPDPEIAGPGRAPADVVYTAAADDLTRIATTPAAMFASSTTSTRPEFGLLAVAVLSLLALCAAAISSAMRRPPIDEELTAPPWSDGLTGLANRRRLDFDLAVDQSVSTSVIMVDVDHFTSVNDRFGQAEGDQVLRLVASMIAEQVRFDDVVYRYGGEQFCVMLSAASDDDARSVAERIVDAAHDIVLPDGDHLTVSVGVGASASPAGEAFAMADHALFAAQHQGRDRAVVSHVPSHEHALLAG